MVCMPLLKAEYIFRDYVYRFYKKDELCYKQELRMKKAYTTMILLRKFLHA